MRTSTAYFAGVGTVVAALVAGLGGGVLISNIVSPHAPKAEMSKLELRMSEKPIAATNASSEPASSPSQAPTGPSIEPVMTGSTQPQPAAAASTSPAPSPLPAAAPVTQAATSDKTNTEPLKPSEAAVARTRDSEVRARDADARREARRVAEEKRKAERRQQWVERRRPRQDQELREVEASIREETEPRRVFAAEPDEMPRIRLFDPE